MVISVANAQFCLRIRDILTVTLHSFVCIHRFSLYFFYVVFPSFPVKKKLRSRRCEGHGFHVFTTLRIFLCTCYILSLRSGAGGGNYYRRVSDVLPTCNRRITDMQSTYNRHNDCRPTDVRKLPSTGDRYFGELFIIFAVAYVTLRS